MTINTKPRLTPKLRFAEFRNTEGWPQQQLGSVATFFKGKGLPKSALIPSGKRPCIHYGELFTEYPEVVGAIRSRTNSDESFFLSHENDVLMPTSDVTPRGLAKACCITSDNIILGGDILVIRTNRDEINGEFLARCLRHHEHKVLKLVSGSTVFHLYASSLERLALPFPSSLPEQRRIASCLSSLDDLIAAERQKLDALKTHKQGLMQHLFPREGETRPLLRFPEFRDAGEWKEKALGTVVTITSSKRVHESEWSATGVPFYRAREIVALSKQESITPLHISEELYSANIKLSGEVCAGHLLVTGVGSIGVPYLVRPDDRFYFKDGNIVWLKNDEAEVTGEFLLRLYETDFVQTQIRKMSDVGTVATYTIENAKRTRLVFPEDKAEQNRIAFSLSSLDDLITAQSDKLEALKTHKKGIMQQLFPSPSEDEV